MGNTVARCEEAPEEAEEPQDEPEQSEAEDSQQDHGEESKEEGAGDDGGDAEGGGEDEEEEEEPKPEVKVDTAPFDVRFPGTNQARHCYARYNEYHKCISTKDEEDESCKFYAKAYRSICPGEWVEKWNEQRDNGTWPGRW